MIESGFPDILEGSPRLHLIGCGGTGVRALAEFAADEGCRLSGTDAAPTARAVERLGRVGLAVQTGHAAEHLPEAVEGVIYSPAVESSNIERVTASQRGVLQASYPQILGVLSRRFPTAAITGTHGKSTATALLGAILAAAGRDRAVLCGAEILGRERHGWAGPGDWCVVEACEYRSHFLELAPRIGIVLSIEADHFDCFPTQDDAARAYAEFVDRITDGEILFTRSDQEATRQLIGRAVGRRVVTLSEQGGAADWWSEHVVQRGPLLSVDAYYQGSRELTVDVPILGRHQAINVLAAVAVARELGVSRAIIADALTHFSGLHRRLERQSDWRGVRRYDDYAHHPTAVRAVLRALREISDGGRLLCVFQPHQISRTEALHSEFAGALSEADEVWVLPVYAARERASPRLTKISESLTTSIPAPTRARFSPSLDRVRDSLETASRPGDLLVTLGAGDIDRLHHDLV